MTLQELEWMLAGKDQMSWDHTASTNHTIASVVNFSGRSVPLSKFHPLLDGKRNKQRVSTLKEKLEGYVPGYRRSVPESREGAEG